MHTPETEADVAAVAAAVVVVVVVVAVVAAAASESEPKWESQNVERCKLYVGNADNDNDGNGGDNGEDGDDGRWQKRKDESKMQRHSTANAVDSRENRVKDNARA